MIIMFEKSYFCKSVNIDLFDKDATEIVYSKQVTVDLA